MKTENAKLCNGDVMSESQMLELGKQYLLLGSKNPADYTKKFKDSLIKQPESNESKPNELICPKCGGKLILRNGKFGTFYGCENYPKCKFTISIAESK
ncbi:MAG: hypothetical protein GX481_08950 [Atopobium sp.]|nr:hypothetical protein [Atopobium sp.]